MDRVNQGIGVGLWKGIKGLAAFTLVSAAILFSACNGTATPPRGSELEAVETPTVQPQTPGSDSVSGLALDRIVYVNSTGNLAMIGPDGRDQRSLTGGSQAGAGAAGQLQAQTLNVDAYYAWPTWSPDGRKIAASRVRVVNNQPQVSIEIIDTSTSLAKSAYVNAGGGLVAQGAPHYLYWSPDSSYLAFIAATGEGLTLFLDEVESEEPPVAVESGAPLYFHWAADSSALLIHRGPEIMLAQRPFREPPRPLLTSNVPFRVPALSPRGTQFAYFGDTGTGRSLLVSPVASPGDASKLLDVGGLAALAWSPNGEELAVADQRSAGGAVFDRLQIISTATGLARTVGEGPIFAFFWSPQGDKIAWVSLNTRNRTFEWMASGVSGEEPQPLFGFQPSSDTLTMLGFFDQYAYSHSPWSPDGSRLVVAGTMQPTFGRQNGHTPTGDRVFVLDTNGGQTPQEIATGTLAVWSWN